MKTRTLILSSILILSSCGWATYDRREKYLEAETAEPVKVPQDLDKPPFESAMEIPDVVDVRNLGGQKVDLGLPEALSSSFGVDMIVIKRLGDERWVFVDAPPAMVWPRIRQYWEDNRMELTRADPGRGIIETDWLVASGEGEASQIYETLKSGLRFSNSRGAVRHKFRLRVESGVRAGSTEVYLVHKTLPLGAPVREDALVWDNNSDNEELEGEVLTGLARYLGDRITSERVVSVMATQIGGQKTELVPDRLRPVLKYHLAFDRAWATVGNALESARINVEDLDRSAAVYYVYYDESRAGEPGFLSRLFGGDDKEAAPGDSAKRFLVQLDTREGEVHVTIKKDPSTLADALVAEKLLKIIKQYST